MDNKEPSEVTHHDLYVALKIMERDLNVLQSSVGRVADDHDRTLQEMREENKARDREISSLKIRMGQVMAISALAAIILPILINSLDPQVRIGDPAPTEYRR